ncbi:MAG TPA: histidinol dehydrogenase [Verrucomicrobiae bacterium]|jgi:histidinol dehydrogenase|nr:histidinol dehydrogenase [Verrucomicrobiae bacterium]
MKVLAGRSAQAMVRKLEQRGSTALARVEKPVRRIVDDVRKNGDRALLRYAEKWDGLGPRQPLKVPATELAAAWDQAPKDYRDALQQAARNIREYCERQKPHEWWQSLAPGVEVGQIPVSLDSAGCYVPGGRYPLPSTVLMTVIPALVAGVERICVVSPRPAAATLAAAFMLRVHDFYRVGGAQAIAALAYGTKSIPRVTKIVGPGNLYVTAAKKQVAFDCAIDFLAGPTEVVIVSDTGDARLIAADLVAQAEHDPEAISIFITTRKALAVKVAKEVKIASAGNAVAEASLRNNGAILLARLPGEAMEWANRIAPEHITVDEDGLRHVRNAGSIFIGDYSPQAAGDYASGPNHVLPTGGAARFRGGLGVQDFLKNISVQRLSREGLERLAPAIITLAEAEGLKAHAESIRVRCARAESA